MEQINKISGIYKAELSFFQTYESISKKTGIKFEFILQESQEVVYIHLCVGKQYPIINLAFPTTNQLSNILDTYNIPKDKFHARLMFWAKSKQEIYLDISSMCFENDYGNVIKILPNPNNVEKEKE